MIVLILLCLFVGFCLLDLTKEINVLKERVDKLSNMIIDYRIEVINSRSKNNEDN